MRKKGMFIVLILVIIALVSACGTGGSKEAGSEPSQAAPGTNAAQPSNTPSSEPQKEIELTFSEPARILSLAPFYVAIEKGFFKEEGIKANITSGGGGAQVIATVLSGDAQFAVSGPRSMFSAIEAGNPMMAVQSLNSALTYEVAVSNKFLEEKNISKDAPLADRLAALNGSTMSTDVVGDSGDVYLRYLMKLHNQDYQSMQMVKLSGRGAKIAGMKQGIVDGGINSPPFASQARNEGVGDLLLKVSEEPMYANMVWEVVFGKKEYIENNPDITKKVVKAIGKGIEFTRNNPKEAAEAIVSYFDGMDVSIVEESLIGMKETFQGYGEMNAESWDNSQIPLIEFGELSGVTQRHDPSEGVFWTNKYIQEVFGTK